MSLVDNKAMRKRLLSLFLVLFALTSLQGCLPDSFKKFKKDPPKAQAAPSAEESLIDEFEDDEEDTFIEDFPSLPTFFRYKFTPGFTSQTFILTSGEEYSFNENANPPLEPVADGFLESGNTPDEEVGLLLQPHFRVINPAADPNYLIFGDGECPEMYDFGNGSILVAYETSLPTGMSFTPWGTIRGQHNDISAGPDGEPLNYCVRFRFENQDGDYEYLFTGIRIGIYKPLPNSFTYSRGNFLILDLDNFTNSIDDFVVGNHITTSALGNASARITHVSKSRQQIYIDNSGHQIDFKVGRFIDTGPFSGGGLEYQIHKATIDDVREVYAVGETIDKQINSHTDILSPQNGVRFFVDLELPPSLTFHQDTGQLEGFINAPLSQTIFNIKAINRLHPSFDKVESYEDVPSTSELNVGQGIALASFSLGIVRPPRNLYITNQYILQLNSNDPFQIGQIITTDVDNNPSVTRENQPFARIIDKFDGDKIVIKMIKGTPFELGQGIDNRYPYGTARGTIFGIIPNNLILDLDSSAGISEGDLVSPPDLDPLDDYDSSYGRVVAINGNRLYLNFSGHPGVTISQGDQITRLGNDSISARTITNIIAANKLISLSGGIVPVESSFQGSPILVDAPQGTGIIEWASGSNARVSITKGFENFTNGEEVSFHNPFQSSGRTINTNRFDHTFYLSRGEPFVAQFGATEGFDISYNISPDLPPGFTIDDETLTLSATALDRTQRLEFTIEAANPIGSSYHHFFIQVYDNFGLELDHTAQNEFKSYVLHNSGEGNQFAPCRITRDEIESKFHDGEDPPKLDCFLEAGEVELYQKGIKMHLDLPKGMCELVQHRPYFIYQYPTAQTPVGNTMSVTKRTGDSELCGVGPEVYQLSNGVRTNQPTLGDRFACYFWEMFLLGESAGNYESINGPNCEEGSYTLLIRDYTYNNFECRNETGSVISISNANSCIRSVGSCGNCTDGLGDPIDCSDFTYSQCDSNPTGEWFSQATHNDPAGATDCDEGWVTCELPATRGFDSSLNEFGTCDFEEDQILIECGGDRRECLASPYLDMIETSGYLNLRNGSFGFRPIQSGQLRKSINYDSPFSMGHETNLAISSYYRDLSCSADERGVTINSDAMLQYAQEDTIDTAPPSHAKSGTQPFYEYACLNSFGDPMATIRLHVRQWASEFSTADPIDMAFPEEVGVGPDLVDGLNDILHGQEYIDREDLTHFMDVPRPFTGDLLSDFPISPAPTGGSCNSVNGIINDLNLTFDPLSFDPRFPLDDI